MDVPAATVGPTPPPATAAAVAAPPSATVGPIPVHSTAGSSQPGAASNQPTDSTLSPVVAKLFNAAEQNITVSFQVTTNPDEVVTVFTDKTTGKEIVQFPSQALIALAQIYDKDAGKVLDKSV
jgi:uncharacterized FlaG/YvyC family protein